MPTHFIGRSEDKTGCCKICAASAHRGAKLEACECLPLLAGRAQKWPSVSHTSCNRWWELMLWLWLCFKAAVKSVEVTKFAQTKKRAVTSLKCQNNVDFFSWCWWDSSQAFCSFRTHSISAVLLECVERIVWVPVTKTFRTVAEWGLVLAP
jgi:hypothetical protein